MDRRVPKYTVPSDPKDMIFVKSHYALTIATRQLLSNAACQFCINFLSKDDRLVRERDKRHPLPIIEFLLIRSYDTLIPLETEQEPVLYLTAPCLFISVLWRKFIDQ